MNRLKSFFNIFLLLGCVCTCFTSCVDDGLGFSSDLKDGETILNLEAAFSPFAEGNLTRTSETPPGRGFNELSDLVILVYDKEGNILQDEDGNNFIKKIDFEQNELSNDDRGDSDTSNDKAPAESKTISLKKIPLKLPFGEYYIIGVANLGSYTESSTIKSTYEKLNTDYADNIQTLDKLRKITVDWEADNYCNNREMLGYFTDHNASAPRHTSTFPTVKVNRPGMQLRAWLRRCASKITIDFDGSALRENVYIYIKDARIYDLAKDCTLGFGKSGVDDEGGTNYNNAVSKEEGLLRKSADHIDYGEGDDYTSWPCITKGTPYIMEGDVKKDFHTQDSNALYFYENMQGDGEDRTPVPDLNGGGVSNNNIKDGKDFGTYIEVTAHYHSDADGNIADYDIKYRFMIGKNVTTNYDAERNYHYKLTLKFRGNANEYHWHIDYNEPEGFDVPNPWYVSYLYNHKAMLPFKFTPAKGWKVTKIEAQIETNPWYASTIAESELKNPNAVIKPIVPDGDNGDAYNTGSAYFKTNSNNCNGFLSLRETSNVIITDKDANKNHLEFSNYDASGKGYLATGTPINADYYYGNGNTLDGEPYIKRDSRTYYFEGADGYPDSSNNGEEKYSVVKSGDQLTFNIPLFTRAKVMVKQTGYTGNNPYVGYQRTAKLKLIATLEKEGEEPRTVEDKVNVVQVRRVVNPKGVYRSETNFSSFHVNMKWLADDQAQNFTPVISEGPWMAEVLGDKNFITLNGRQSISGSTKTEIDFTIKFNRMNTKKIKNAVIRILYHNYTCTHLIFVRQGYDPQEIAPNGKQFPEVNGKPSETNNPTKWGTFNMISQDLEADDPRDEGSLFKYGNSTQPIDAINNAYKRGGEEFYTIPADNEFVDQNPLFIANKDGEISDKNKVHWTNITEDVSTGFKGKGKMDNTATIRDFEQLYLTENIQFGYGVLYADGATETQTSVNDAYGYYRRDPDRGKKGMRGMFAYFWNKHDPNNSYTGRSVFFPIGRSGFGHRKEGIYVNSSGNVFPKESGAKQKIGLLRYSSGRYEAAPGTFGYVAPLFVSLYRRPGAIYWARETVPNKQYLQWNGTVSTDDTAFGLDINYFTFDVNAISISNICNGKDACFVRTVLK